MILFNFNVIAEAAPTLALRTPDRPGIQLFRQFFDQNVGRVAIVVDEDYEREAFEQWLKLYNLLPSSYDILASSDPVIKAEKVHLFMSAWGKTDWYIDADPRTVTHTLRLGIPTLLVASPYIVRPEWQPNYAPQSWTDLVAEIEEQNVAKVEKQWRNLQ